MFGVPLRLVWMGSFRNSESERVTPRSKLRRWGIWRVWKLNLRRKFANLPNTLFLSGEKEFRECVTHSWKLLRNSLLWGSNLSLKRHGGWHPPPPTPLLCRLFANYLWLWNTIFSAKFRWVLRRVSIYIDGVEEGERPPSSLFGDTRAFLGPFLASGPHPASVSWAGPGSAVEFWS